jgi:restriction system protein
MTSDEAFAFLTQEANQQLKTVQEQGATHLRQGNHVEARRALDRAEQIKKMIASLQELKEHWRSPAFSVVRLPSPDPDPDPVVHHRGSFGRLDNGQKTPQTDYYIPILQALVEMRGSGTSENVLKRVEEIMGNRLNAYDHMTLPRGGDIRWRNTAQWARFDLRDKGYLIANSPRGIWEITPAGRTFLEKSPGKKIESR